jgi:hypothetical protein
MRQNKPQLYGTQLSYNKEKKEVFIWPIHDLDNLEERRKNQGLSSMQEELKLLHNMEWDIEEYRSKLPELEKYTGITTIKTP